MQHSYSPLLMGDCILQTLIDIRETYSKDGKDGLPGKKGIALTLEQYHALKDLIPSVR